MKRFCLIILCLALACWTIEAKKVKGKVTCAGKGIPSVIVTDGKSFTQTAEDGSFRLKVSKDAEFVQIVTPSGYTADYSSGVPAFYKRVEGTDSFTFELNKFGDGETSYNIIAVGDPQPRTKKHFEEFAGKPLDDICRTISELDGPTVGVALGDICFDVLPLLKSWKDKIIRTGIPFYTVAGNHDHDKKIEGDDLAIHAYRETLGPENYAFYIGKDLMIGLDNIIYYKNKKYELGYTDEIISWVENLMKYIPKSADIYIAQHSPLNGRHFRKMIINHEKLLQILDGHTITFLSGHNHVSGRFDYAPGVTEHNIAAICGTWWDAYHCTDGTPRGYKVFSKKDGDLTWYYKSIDKDKDFQYEVFMPGTTQLHPESVVINVWDYDTLWDIEWWEDGKSMGKMEQVEEFSPIHTQEIKEKYAGAEKGPSSYKLTRKAKHYFAAKPSEGAKEIKIVIKNRFGKVWEERVQL